MLNAPSEAGETKRLRIRRSNCQLSALMICDAETQPRIPMNSRQRARLSRGTIGAIRYETIIMTSGPVTVPATIAQ